MAMGMLSILLLLSPAAAVESTPIAKVVQLLGDLQAKVRGEGADATRVYKEMADGCHKNAQNLGFDIKTGKSEVAELKAAMEEQSARIETLGSKIDETSSAISVSEADLKAATEVRHKESADFNAQRKELEDIINTLERAIAIIQREMAKGGASMLQLQSAKSLTQALGVMVEASMFGSADAHRLTALVQSAQTSDDEEIGAPAAAVYESKSGGVVDALSDLLDKAQTQLSDAMKKETEGKHNFDLLEQSLKDETRFGEKNLAEAQKNLAATNEAKSVSTGDLGVTSKDLAADELGLTDLNQRCMEAAEDFEAAAKSRDEELAAIAKATTIIQEATNTDLIQSGASFFQVSSSMELSNFEAVRFVRDMARKNKSPALYQLASRMATAIRGGESGFDKVRGLIEGMIERLESEASEEATEKAYCDKELAETHEKQADKTGEISKLTTKIDQMSARSAKLKGQVADLQKGLAALAEEQAEDGQLRQEEKELFTNQKAETEKGLQGIKLALKVLREYYAQDGKKHDAAEGAGSGIIGLLEVIESNFSKGLAEIIATEENSVAAFEQATKDAQIERAAKEQDVKYKSKESSGLDKSIAEATSDRAGVQSELDAVMEYLTSLEKRCIAKAETYAERAGRRASEISGLKEALTILDGETALLQRKAHRVLRGRHGHA